MRKTIFLSLLVGLGACDDGDLQIEAVDFDEVGIQSCPGIEEPTETTFFFKIDEDEALLLNLAEGLIKNETSESGTLTSTIPSPSNLIYRLFSDNVTSGYFCDDLPPLEPTVLKENSATAGDISIDTRVDTLTANAKEYAHTISITGLSLENDQGEQLTDLSTLVYGDFITRPANSARLDVPFSNYSEIAFDRCAPAPIDGTLRLEKTINDEFIALDVPEEENLFENVATLDTVPRTIVLEDNDIFKYIVLDTQASEFACEATFGESVKSWQLVSTAGTLIVETVEGQPEANGNIPYTHTITIEGLVLTAKGVGTNGEDVNLPEIPNLALGTYSTTLEQS